MAFATSNGSKIAYETLGTGPTVVMQHGLFGNRHSWQDRGFVAALQADYQLVLIDSLGHGESDCPHEPARYGLESRAGDIAAVLDDLGVERAHYVGYSMGGWMGTGVARYHGDRLSSLAIGGWDLKNGAAAAIAQMQIDNFADIIGAASDMSEEIAAGIRDGDRVALEACWDALGEIEGAVEGVVATGVPTLVWCGRDDPYFEAVAELANEIDVRFRAVDGDHVGAMTDLSRQSVESVQAFLAAVR